MSPCQPELASVHGWCGYRGAAGPTNFLAAAAGTALCMVCVESDEWGWCSAFEQTRERATCGPPTWRAGEFILEDPIVPVVTDQNLAEVADCSGVRSSESGSGSENAEQNQWNAGASLPLRRGAKVYLGSGPRTVATLVCNVHVRVRTRSFACSADVWPDTIRKGARGRRAAALATPTSQLLWVS